MGGEYAPGAGRGRGGRMNDLRVHGPQCVRVHRPDPVPADPRGRPVPEPGSLHLGASGVAHGLGFLLFALGVLRRDRAAVAAGMIAFMFYGGMLLTVLPHEPGVSWQAHLGGAVAGLAAAWLFRRSDPMPPRKRYSWEFEEDAGEGDAGEGAA